LAVISLDTVNYLVLTT